jgi:indolepyruvate ferredoxin oxidoreductase
MATDPRFLCSSGREVFTGNEILIKAALETEGGVHLITGYPGSPVGAFFDVLGDVRDLLKQNGVRAFQANNEALGAAAANGSQMAACRAIVTMKSVGVHVASDALAIGNLAGPHPQGGVVVITGDDPWCDSTQVPSDSRFLYEHLRIAVVEPGTSQELKDWVDLSFKLSAASGLYVGFIVTTAQADGGGTIDCKPNQFPQINMKQKIALDTQRVDLERVLLPPRSWQKELEMPGRFVKAVAAARELGLNRIIPASAGHWPLATDHCPIGFIVTGMGGPYLRHVLSDIGLDGAFPVLQMGMCYPTDIGIVAEFSKLCKTMIVIEERRSFVEKNIRDTAFRELSHDQAAELTGRLFGKKFPAVGGAEVEGIPDTRGLNPSVLAQKLIPLIKSTEQIPAELRNGRLAAEMNRIRKASKPKLAVFNDKVIARTPTFCPGCPHRDSSATLLELRKNFADPAYMKQHHAMGPVDLVAHGDTGCYTMLMFAPTEQLMHNYSGMGLGGGTGSGIDPFITNKQIVFMGDGTFFHSGAVAISNAIKLGQDISFIILENKTTAMTGHQEHAGTEVDVLGNRSYVQDIDAIVRAMAGTSPLTVVKLSPEDRTRYRSVLEKTILSDGVKVIIADKECGITHQRTVMKQERQTIKKHGYLPRKTHMNITPEVCEGCMECTKATACPGLTTVDTDYGRKIDTDLTWCVNDGACERVRTSNEAGTTVKPCPSFEQVTIVRQKRRRYTLPHMALDKLPEPAKRIKLENPGDTWRAHLSGVGGMGIGVVNAILVRAGHKEGFRVLFQDKKGLAIRNGGVYSQISFVKDAEAAPKPDGKQSGAGPETIESPSSFSIQHSSFSISSNTTGSIPYGQADLLLGIDILEAARAIDPRQDFRVASPERTSAVLNTYKQPTVYTLLGEQDFDPESLQQEIFDSCRPETSYAKNISELCEQRLGSKLYANIMMLGLAYQLGLIPVSAWSIAWAIKDSIRREHRKNLKAFNIGRKLALEPRALPGKPEPVTWEQLVTNKSRVLRRTGMFGRARADAFEKLCQGAMKQMRDLPEQAKYDLALRIYDLSQYQNAAFAKQYIDQVRSVYRRDDPKRQYAATVAALKNLAKVKLIKDEPYVAYLLTRFEKKQRDIVKYGVDVNNGDRIVYRHHTSPEFNIGRHRIRLRITTRDWHLRIVSNMKWWRKLPGWHRRETAFRDWYVGLLDRVNLSHDAGYALALRALTCPEDVSGYREVRYPKQDKVRLAIEQEFTNTPGGPKVEVTVNRDVLKGFRTPTRA